MQAKLLSRASKWVKPGGALVYAVCSLEPQEGEERIEGFLGGRDDFAAAAPTGLPTFLHPSERGFVRVLPGLLEAEGGLDGFFIARLVRRG